MKTLVFFLLLIFVCKSTIFNVSSNIFLTNSFSPVEFVNLNSTSTYIINVQGLISIATSLEICSNCILTMDSSSSLNVPIINFQPNSQLIINSLSTFNVTNIISNPNFVLKVVGDTTIYSSIFLKGAASFDLSASSTVKKKIYSLKWKNILKK